MTKLGQHVAAWAEENKRKLEAISASVEDCGDVVNISIAGNTLQFVVPSGWESTKEEGTNADEEANILCVNVVDHVLEEMILELNEKLQRIKAGDGALIEALHKILCVLEVFCAKVESNEGEGEEEDEEADEGDEDDGGFDMSFDNNVPASSKETPQEESSLGPFSKKNSSSSSPAATQAIMREYHNIVRQISSARNAASGDGVSPLLTGIKVEMPDESNLYKWEVRLHKDLFKEWPLHRDISKLEYELGKDVDVQLEVTFPSTFPFAPPFVRVVSPRFSFHTGHVTVGGSICMELLTMSGWSPACSFESLLVQIVNAMIEGNGRIDFRIKQEYSLDAAREAFQRVASAHGWQ